MKDKDLMPTSFLIVEALSCISILFALFSFFEFQSCDGGNLRTSPSCYALQVSHMSSSTQVCLYQGVKPFYLNPIDFVNEGVQSIFVHPLLAGVTQSGMISQL